MNLPQIKEDDTVPSVIAARIAQRRKDEEEALKKAEEGGSLFERLRDRLAATGPAQNLLKRYRERMDRSKENSGDDSDSNSPDDDPLEKLRAQKALYATAKRNSTAMPVQSPSSRSRSASSFGDLDLNGATALYLARQQKLQREYARRERKRKSEARAAIMMTRAKQAERVRLINARNMEIVRSRGLEELLEEDESFPAGAGTAV